MDGLSCEMDGARCQTDASRASNRPETAVVSHSEGAGMYLGAGGVKGDVEVTDGIEHHVHTSTGHGAVPSVKTKVIIPANAVENISIPQKKVKLPDLPIETARGHPDKLNGCRNLADMSSICMDGHSDGDETETTVNETESIRKCRNSWTMRNLPIMPEIK